MPASCRFPLHVLHWSHFISKFSRWEMWKCSRALRLLESYFRIEQEGIYTDSDWIVLEWCGNMIEHSSRAGNIWPAIHWTETDVRCKTWRVWNRGRSMPGG